MYTQNGGISLFWTLYLLFTEEEVKNIRKIPLSSTDQKDTLIWRGTKNGVFSVRSAYHMQKELLN
jgi:hypothetical protein